MKALHAAAHAITRKVVKHEPIAFQTATHIETPRGDVESLLHEIGHYVAASDLERMWPNLFLDEWHDNDADLKATGLPLPSNYQNEDAQRERVEQREREACCFTEWVLEGLVDTPRDWVVEHSGSPLTFPDDPETCKTYLAHRITPKNLQRLRDAVRTCL